MSSCWWKHPVHRLLSSNPWGIPGLDWVNPYRPGVIESRTADLVAVLPTLSLGSRSPGWYPCITIHYIAIHCVITIHCNAIHNTHSTALLITTPLERFLFWRSQLHLYHLFSCSIWSPDFTNVFLVFCFKMLTNLRSVVSLFKTRPPY